MKIYDFKGFPNPARVRMAVAEKGLADRVEYVTVNVPEGEHKAPAFTAKNPAAAVPVLINLLTVLPANKRAQVEEYLQELAGDRPLASLSSNHGFFQDNPTGPICSAASVPGDQRLSS